MTTTHTHIVSCTSDGLPTHSCPPTVHLIGLSVEILDVMAAPVSLAIVSLSETFLLMFLLGTPQIYADDSHDTCHWPNGDISPKDSACTDTGRPSACCPVGWECLSNNLCYNELAKTYERTSCTDRSWDDMTCLGMCTKSKIFL